jgi:hypothetical protein
MSEKYYCENCPHWQEAGEHSLDDGHITRIGRCLLNPPSVYFLPTARVDLRGAGIGQSLQPHFTYPVTQFNDRCGQHPRMRHNAVASLIHVAVSVYFKALEKHENRLQFDPDRFPACAGFNRAPTLDELKEFASDPAKFEEWARMLSRPNPDPNGS